MVVEGRLVRVGDAWLARLPNGSASQLLRFSTDRLSAAGLDAGRAFSDEVDAQTCEESGPDPEVQQSLPERLGDLVAVHVIARALVPADILPALHIRTWG